MSVENSANPALLTYLPASSCGVFSIGIPLVCRAVASGRNREASRAVLSRIAGPPSLSLGGFQHPHAENRKESRFQSGFPSHFVVAARLSGYNCGHARLAAINSQEVATVGVGKWWLKYGPGSPGSVAKAMVGAYRSIRTREPGLAQNQLLATTLESRYVLAPSRFSIPVEARRKLLAEVQDQLVCLVVAVFLLERGAQGRLADWETAPLAVKRLAIEVIIEVVSDLDPDTSLGWDADLMLGWAEAFMLKMQIGGLSL